MRATGAAPDARVVVAGYSLGGVVARIATARYEADAEWRAALGVRENLPVRLIVFGDAPLEGAHASYCLQAQIWSFPVPFGSYVDRPERKFNLNSCGAQQLLRLAVSGLEPGWGPEANGEAFYRTGQRVYLREDGVCDRRGFLPAGLGGGAACVCDEGPAVLGIGGAGFASVRTIAFSDGASPGPNTCYGDTRDLDSGGKRVCTVPAGASAPYPLQMGDALYKLCYPAAPDPFPCLAQPEDIVAGSRLSSLASFDTALGGAVKFGVDQLLSATFIPYESALPAGAPFAATTENDWQGVHGRGYPRTVQWALEQIEEAFR